MKKLLWTAALLVAQQASAQAQAPTGVTTSAGYVGQVSSLVVTARTELSASASAAQKADACRFLPTKTSTLLDYGATLATRHGNTYQATGNQADASLHLAVRQAQNALMSVREAVQASCTLKNEPLAAAVTSLALKVAQLEVEGALRSSSDAVNASGAK